MSLHDSLFSEDVEHDVTLFSRGKTRKRVLVFPPVNNYRRYIIHQLVQDRFVELHTFSIGQGTARRTVVCYKSDFIRDPKVNAVEHKTSPETKRTDSLDGMGVEGRRSPSASPDRARSQRQVKSVPAIEIYRPPAARKVKNSSQVNAQRIQIESTTSSSVKNSRQKRPDRAVYVPRHRRTVESKGNSQCSQSARANRTALGRKLPKVETELHLKQQEPLCTRQSIENLEKGSRECDSSNQNSDSSTSHPTSESENQCDRSAGEDRISVNSADVLPVESQNALVDAIVENVPDVSETQDSIIPEEECKRMKRNYSPLEEDRLCNTLSSEDKRILDVDAANVNSEVNLDTTQLEKTDKCSDSVLISSGNSSDQTKPNEEQSNRDEVTNHKNKRTVQRNMVSDVLIISDDGPKEEKKTKELPIIPMTPSEKKVKKIERQKSKPAAPPSPPLKINRDECDWDSLFDDNGDCLDPTLIDELTSAVGEVMIEQPKNDYKAYSKQVEVSSDEFAHVVEIYNFPSEFKTSDLAAVFSPFKSGGFELKWVDDTHCLGVFSSPLIAAEVLASDHPFVKTRPLSEATALSKTKARRSAEFLQPYRSRPETCAALARRLVTGALGVKLATARQEREHEKNVLREAKEKRRLANKQREDAWEGIIPEK